MGATTEVRPLGPRPLSTVSRGEEGLGVGLTAGDYGHEGHGETVKAKDGREAVLVGVAGQKIRSTAASAGDA